MRQDRDDDAGFTIAEIVVALGILSIVLVVAFEFLVSATNQSTALEDRTYLQADGRLAVDQVVRDLRQAYSDTGTPAIETIGPSALTFLSPDSGQPFRLRRVAYRVQGNALQRSVTTSADADGAPWVFPATPAPFATVLSDVQNSDVFSYTDDDAVATSDPGAVRTVHISVALRPGSARTSAHRYETAVHVRVKR